MNMERAMRLAANTRYLSFVLAVMVYVISCLMPAAAFAVDLADALAPKTRTIKIKPITQDVIYLMPGRAVRIIFPWILDRKDAKSEMPFYARLSTDNIFQFENKEDQNSIIIHAKQISKEIQGEYTELNITSRGYHFTFTIIADFAYKKHYSNIVMELGKEDRMAMLEDERKKYLASLIEERESMIKDIDARAEKLALQKVGELSMGSHSSSNVKEEKKITLDNGDEVILYVDKVRKFGSFSVINIEVNNRSNMKPLYLNDIRLKSVKNGVESEPFLVGAVLPPKLDLNQIIETVVVTSDRIPEEDIALQLVTDRGEVTVEW